jgi:cobalt-precorrin 5A hydrolase
MRVAGFGFRGTATLASLLDALDRAGGEVGLLATAEEKAGAPVAGAFAARLGLALVPVSRERLAGADVLTRSARVMARFGTGSVAEAAALAAAGRGARLVGPRVVSGDGLATVAIAERVGE